MLNYDEVVHIILCILQLSDLVKRMHYHLWLNTRLIFRRYLLQISARMSAILVKRQGREADRSPPSGAEVKKGGAIPPHPICLHGIVFNKLRTGTALPYILDTMP
jgi:hypothetical protein